MSRYGMVIDLDRCTGCGTCVVACAVENNVPPAHANATDRTGITLMRVHRINDGSSYPSNRVRFVPMPCQHCDDPPCETVCPQAAVERDAKTGIVDQMPQRCLGCRYCMAACPYHARYFNWWDPAWPAGMERSFNPAVAPRMRGVVEKCDFCQGRLQEARAKAAANKQPLDPADYEPACVENCPVQAIAFGDLDDPKSEVAKAVKSRDTFRFLERIGTQAKVHYRSTQPWVRQLTDQPLVRIQREAPRA